MGLWKHQGSNPYDKGLKMMELYIETLTGTAFELRVSPYETIQDVKARIQRLEGIPMCQQHLVWQSLELEDDYSLHDYAIHDGATLRLVLTMRGGPINTRRVPVEDASLREMAEYFSEASKEELMDKLPAAAAQPGNRPVTVIVYHNGDQLNFFRVVDRDANSPASESLSGASMYNLYDDDDEDVEGLKERLDDNDKTRSKMKVIRTKMEDMNINKKPVLPGSSSIKKPSPPPPQLAPHPPTGPRPPSMTRLRTRFPSAAKPSSGRLLNRNACLPPVGQPQQAPPAREAASPPAGLRALSHLLKESEEKEGEASRSLASAGPGRGLGGPLTSVAEDEDAAGAEEGRQQQAEVLEALLRRAAPPPPPPRKWDMHADVLLKDSGGGGGGSAGGKKGESAEPRPTTSSKRPQQQLSLDALAESLTKPSPSSRREGRAASRSSVILESLHPSEVRAMSGLLTSYVQRASAGSKSRSGGKEGGRRTPDSARMMSGSRLGRRGSGLVRGTGSGLVRGDGRLSPRALPPMKHKKKTAKRCFLCGRKTGLATTYQCRCGESFCANHRYAESHKCTFDYKSEGRKLLQQSNPVVTAPKLPKI